MNIADIITVVEDLPETTNKEAKDALEWARWEQKSITSMEEISNGNLLEYGEKRAFGEISTRVEKRLFEHRGTILAKTMSLPSDLTKTQDVISLAAQSPKVSLKEVRPLADKLGFAVLPFDYLADESWGKESYEMQRSIQSFSELEPWFNIYVMTPLDFYSVQKHVKSEEDLPIYSPSFAAQSFMAISMAIPMFRSMKGNIEQLAQNDRRLANQLQSVNEEIKNLKLRVDDLAKAIDQQTREAAAARVREKELIQRLEEYEARFVPLDPMMLAIPKDISIRDAKGHCIVGPFWGPDFPKIVEAALQLEAVEGQRAKLKRLASKYGAR